MNEWYELDLFVLNNKGSNKEMKIHYTRNEKRYIANTKALSIRTTFNLSYQYSPMHLALIFVCAVEILQNVRDTS